MWCAFYVFLPLPLAVFTSLNPLLSLFPDLDVLAHISIKRLFEILPKIKFLINCGLTVLLRIFFVAFTWHVLTLRMSYHSRRILTPDASRKRKERETFYPLKPFASAQHLSGKPNIKPEDSSVSSSNRLLAGYMAYEYLTKGTLFGQKLDPARTDGLPLDGGCSGGSSSAQLKKRGMIIKPAKVEPEWGKENKIYAEVARILKTDGTHIRGIVNPSQLAWWIQM